ncbi:MFS transporter [Thermodesulfobacteriota bacterium]
MQRNTLLILILFALNFVRYGMVFPLVPLLANDLGTSPAVIGLIVGSFGMLSFFLSIPIGGFTDRVGVKRVLALGVICNILSALLLIRADHVLTLAVSQIVGGLAFQLHIVSGQTFIASIDSPLRRESGFGYLTFSAALGQTLGPLLGGVIATRFGYQGAFFAVLLVSIPGLMIIGFREPERSLVPDRYSLRRDLRHAAVILSDSRMLVVLAITFVVIFSVSLRASFLPVLLLLRGSSEAVVGLLISLFAGTSTLIRLFVGRLLKNFSRRALIGFSALTVAAGVGLIPMLPSLLTVALSLCIFGMGFGLFQPLTMVMVADLTDPRHSGLSMGIRFMAMTLATILGPFLMGLLVGNFGLPSAFYVSALFVITTGVYILTWKSELLPVRREQI